MSFPDAVAPDKVGSYPARTFAGGGYVWDEVLEYRVWCSPSSNAEDLCDGSDYYYAYASFDAAQSASSQLAGASEPIALIMQREYLDEPEPGNFVHITQARITEWPVDFLSRPRRDERTIPDFLAPDAPPNRLDILRGTAARPSV